MTDHRARYGPHNPDETYIAHDVAEQLVDLGEIQMNYATSGDAVVAGAAAHPRPDRVVVGVRGGHAAARRALPGVRRRSAGPGPQHAHARPLHARQHGQRPRPLHRPGDRAADDRERPVLRRRPLRLAVGVRQARSGASRALYEDPPLFASEVRPAVGPGIRQCIGPLFDLWSTFLGDQWSIGAWDAMREGAAARLPEHLRFIPVPDEPPQNLKEYDPEWGRSFWTGTRRRRPATTSGCCAASRSPSVLLTHHMRITDEASGFLLGAMSDQQAQRVQDLLTGAGVTVQYRSFPDVGHSMHGDTTRALRRDPARLGQGPRRREARRRTIDVHAHYLPASYRAALLDNGHGEPDGFPQIPDVVRRGARRRDGSARDRDVAAVDLVARCAPRRRRQRLGTCPRGERGRPTGGRRPSRTVRPLRLAPAARRRCGDGRDRALLRAPRRRRLHAAHQRRRDLSGRPGLPTGLPRARPARRPAVHPPDVAGVLGAHLARAAPADARVLLRHHPGRGRPGAQRHHRQRTRGSSSSSRTPGRRCRWSPTGSASSPCCSTSTPPWTCSAIWAGSTSTSPASRFPASSTRFSRSRRSSTSTTAATTPSRPSSRPTCRSNDWPSRWTRPPAAGRAPRQHGTALP